MPAGWRRAAGVAEARRRLGGQALPRRPARLRLSRGATRSSLPARAGCFRRSSPTGTGRPPAPRSEPSLRPARYGHAKGHRRRSSALL
jgi:hypothetical protein